MRIQKRSLGIRREAEEMWWNPESNGKTDASFKWSRNGEVDDINKDCSDILYEQLLIHAHNIELKY